MPRRPDVPCAQCGKLMYAGKGSLPAGYATCHACRRASPVPYGVRTVPRSAIPCPSCGQDFIPKATRGRGIYTRTCSKSCGVRLRTPRRSEDDRRRTRYERELITPGLSRHQRDRLRLGWVARGRHCFYCEIGQPETVDHVVPLVRGGTNGEGNLVPACRSCNSSKGTLLLVEWRSARATRLRLMRDGLRSEAA